MRAELYRFSDMAMCYKCNKVYDIQIEFLDWLIIQQEGRTFPILCDGCLFPDAG